VAKKVNLKILGVFSQESPGLSHGEDVNVSYLYGWLERAPVVQHGGRGTLEEMLKEPVHFPTQRREPLKGPPPG
jgi:hypothetical protein